MRKDSLWYIMSEKYCQDSWIRENEWVREMVYFAY
jgi:hypothetical protein